MVERRHLPHVSSFRDNPIVFFTICTHKRRKLLACTQGTSFYVSYGNDRQNEMAGVLVITFSCPITFISLGVVQLPRSQWRSGCRCGRASALASSRPPWKLHHLSGNRITLIAIFDHEKITGRNGIMWSKMRCERD